MRIPCRLHLAASASSSSTSTTSSLLLRRRRSRCYSTQADSSSNSNNDNTSTTSTKKAYGSTLNLPSTHFEMRSKPEIREKLYRSRTCDRLYHWQREHNKGDPFVLHDGPPYANGDLHMGHALNKIIKDIINRFQVLQGRKVHFVPGWDCHGLPIEAKAVGKFKGRNLREIPPLEIREAARTEATKSIAAQKSQFQEFAIMADWSQEGTYRTFDRSYEMRQLKIFGEMARRGLIYRAHRPVYWSPSSRTALAEAELEYEEKHLSRSCYVRFPLSMEDGIGQGLKVAASENPEAQKALQEASGIDLVVWTTTPWTLPSNMAVAVNPEMRYSLARLKKDKSLLIVASERIETICGLKMGLSGPKNVERETWGDVEEIMSFPGTSLLDSRYRHLFLDSSRPSRPILPASFVTDSSGTGLVHAAPAHGADDYEMFLSAGLLLKEPLISPVDDDGNYTQEILKLGHLGRDLVGLPVLGEGGKLINQILNDQKVLISEVPMVHKYPYDWRTKLPVITRATSQWFANLDRIKGDAVKALEPVRFTPSSSRSRLESFVRGRSEWCISRQRVWGVPIPVLYDSATDEALLSEENINHITKVLEEKGTDYWWVGEAEEFVSPEYRNDSKSWKKGNDTVDVWFDSGTSWSMLDSAKPNEPNASTTNAKPLADVYFEGTDQHRGWFQSSLLTRIATSSSETSNPDQQSSSTSTSTSASSTPAAPFSNLLTHGFVVDRKGRKMAKSLGNGIDPLLIIKGGENKNKDPAFGADVLRLWAAKADYTGDTPIGPLIIKNTEDSLRKLRNTARFMLANLPKPEEVPELDQQELSLPDRFLLHELHELERSCRAAYSSFDFAQVARRLSEFANSTLSTLWFDISKSTLYSDPPNSEARRACIAVLDQTLRTFTSILAPITPHLAEEIEHYRIGSTSDPPSTSASASDDLQSVFQKGWQSVDPKWRDEELSKEVKTLLKVRDETLVLIETVRQNKDLKSAIESGIDIYFSGAGSEQEDQVSKVLFKYQDQLSRLFIVSDVRIFQHSLSSSNPTAESSNQAWLPVSCKSNCSEKVHIVVRPALGKECPRCWIYQSKVENELCERCETAVKLSNASM